MAIIYGDYPLQDRETFSSCCGSTYRVNQKTRRWKNQHGEGVIKGKEADPVAQNNLGIFLCEGFAGKAGPFDNGMVNHIKTKNGNITISIREKM